MVAVHGGEGCVGMRRLNSPMRSERWLSVAPSTKVCAWIWSARSTNQAAGVAPPMHRDQRPPVVVGVPIGAPWYRFGGVAGSGGASPPARAAG